MAPMVFFKHWHYWKHTQKSVCPHITYISVLFSACRCHLLLNIHDFSNSQSHENQWHLNKRCFPHIFEGNISPRCNQNIFWMYFARLSESFMSFYGKYLHFVFNILPIQVATFTKATGDCRRSCFCPQSLSGRSLLHQGEYFAPVAP